jgi:hypothetical protein
MTWPYWSTQRVQVHPPARHPHIRFVDEPAVTAAVAAAAGRVDEQRREGLHPAVHADVVDHHASLGQQLLDVTVREAVPQIPAHGQDDHVGREPVASEG